YFLNTVFLLLLDTVASECDPTKLAPPTCTVGQTIFCLDRKQFPGADLDKFVPFNSPKDSKCNTNDFPVCCDAKATELLVSGNGNMKLPLSSDKNDVDWFE
ncbi:hypothetical protein PSTT_16242, partial [Puccinia striiformis]